MGSRKLIFPTAWANEIWGYLGGYVSSKEVRDTVPPDTKIWRELEITIDDNLESTRIFHHEAESEQDIVSKRNEM